MSTNKCPARRGGVKLERIGKETIIYTTDQKAIHVLNPTAQVIWELCDGEHTIEDIEVDLRKRFAVPVEADLIGDVRRTIAVFSEKGLLEQGS